LASQAKSAMRVQSQIFDPFTQQLMLPAGVSPAVLEAVVAALQSPVRVTNVTGTAIPGTLSGANKVFTRSDGKFHIDRQVLTVKDIVATQTEALFRVGEEVWEAGGAKGTVAEAFGATVVMKDVYNAVFTGIGALTGQSSTVAATGDGVQTRILPLANQLVWAHVTGSPAAGALVRVIANNATTLTTLEAMLTGATAVMLFAAEEDAVQAMEIEVDKPLTYMQGIRKTTTGALTAAEGNAVVLLVDATAANMVLTLPDVRSVPENQQYCFVGIEVEAKTFKIASPVAAQTLDGVNILAVQYAAMNANGDFLIIKRLGDVWVTMTSGIQ